MKTILLTAILGISFINLSIGQICSPPSASAELNAGNVRAGLLNGGDFWWDGISEAKYEYPKVGPGQTSIHALFAGAIWLSARDNANNLKLAAMTFRIQGFDFYPGPINSNTGILDANACSFFNRFWEVQAIDIQNHISITNLGIPIPLAQIPLSILEWPAKGNTHITSFSINEELAPYKDSNNNNIYDPENGDYPLIIGDQAIFWVINDIGGIHERTGGNPLGVEVQFMAYAFADPNSPLFNSTIYEVKAINKSGINLNDFRFGLYSDPDLGNVVDDYIGCDTTLDAAFVYNFNDTDYVYGPNPPVISIQFLNQELEAFNLFFNGGPPGV